MPALAYAKAAAHAACPDDFAHARHVQRRLTTLAPPKERAIWRRDSVGDPCGVVRPLCGQFTPACDRPEMAGNGLVCRPKPDETCPNVSV
jgi:hypothetical protein